MDHLEEDLGEDLVASMVDRVGQHHPQQEEEDEVKTLTAPLSTR